MQRLEVSSAIRHIDMSLGGKELVHKDRALPLQAYGAQRDLGG
jgi:hypothetical protein